MEDPLSLSTLLDIAARWINLRLHLVLKPRPPLFTGRVQLLIIVNEYSIWNDTDTVFYSFHVVLNIFLSVSLSLISFASKYRVPEIRPDETNELHRGYIEMYKEPHDQ